MAANGNPPPEGAKLGPNAPRHGSLGEQVLSHAQAGREVVQDFVPLADSVEWELGQQYLRQRGNKAFLSDVSPVPFIVNNDGALSRNAADVFFSSLLAADQLGQLDGDIVVLELGIGVGLFARYFLDCMRDLCRQHKKDYYDRLCYVAADRSERMLQDVLWHGVLAEHPGRYCVRQLDALRPEELLGVGHVSYVPGGLGHVGNVPQVKERGHSGYFFGSEPGRRDPQKKNRRFGDGPMFRIRIMAKNAIGAKAELSAHAQYGLAQGRWPQEKRAAVLCRRLTSTTTLLGTTSFA